MTNMMTQKQCFFQFQQKMVTDPFISISWTPFLKSGPFFFLIMGKESATWCLTSFFVLTRHGSFMEVYMHRTHLYHWRAPICVLSHLAHNRACVYITPIHSPSFGMICPLKDEKWEKNCFFKISQCPNLERLFMNMSFCIRNGTRFLSGFFSMKLEHIR